MEEVRKTMEDIKKYESRESYNKEQADLAKCYFAERHGDWLVEQVEQGKKYREVLEFIQSIKYDDDFNPYAYMMLEIMVAVDKVLGETG